MNTIWHTLRNLEQKWPAYAEANRHELAYTQVVHQTDLIVGKGVPGVYYSRITSYNVCYTKLLRSTAGHRGN